MYLTCGCSRARNRQTPQGFLVFATARTDATDSFRHFATSPTLRPEDMASKGAVRPNRTGPQVRGAGLGLDEMDLRVGADAVVEGFHFAVSADVDVIDVHLRVRVLLAQVGRVLERAQAADPRAIGQMVGVARAGALNEREAAAYYCLT